jgi:hypothetical protein
MSSEQTLPERPAAQAEAEASASAEGGEKLSKKALKKLEKEREKVGTEPRLHHSTNSKDI